jgi:hypothetical protein
MRPCSPMSRVRPDGWRGEGAEAQAVRKALKIGGSGFVAVLVGTDGGVKLRAEHPLDGAALFPLIDAMPMQQKDVRDRGS